MKIFIYESAEVNYRVKKEISQIIMDSLTSKVLGLSFQRTAFFKIYYS